MIQIFRDQGDSEKGYPYYVSARETPKNDTIFCEHQGDSEMRAERLCKHWGDAERFYRTHNGAQSNTVRSG